MFDSIKRRLYPSKTKSEAMPDEVRNFIEQLGIDNPESLQQFDGSIYGMPILTAMLSRIEALESRLSRLENQSPCPPPST